MPDARPAPVPTAPLLIDVTRLIWRAWAGRLPTGIDRVCRAYVEHFGARARAVVQRGNVRLVLSPRDSQALFALLGAPQPRRRLATLLAGAIVRALGSRPPVGAQYLNIGHTGLDAPDLPDWIARYGLRAIYLIHDLIPIRAPEFCRPGEAEKHARRIGNALASASGFVVNSQATLDDLHAFAAARGVACAPATVAWLAADALAPPGAPPPPAAPCFVTIGTIEGRKNHLLLLQLWQRLAARLGEDTPRLLIVGQRGWEAGQALAMLDRCRGLAGHVVELGHCEDAELARLVARARAVLMPSFAEGYGMPVVEALRLGTPVIASDLPVFREIAGTIPSYLPPHDGVGWEAAVLAFCGDAPERVRQLAALPSYVAPDWPSHFAIVERFLAKLDDG